jgi:hypothetical protein
VTPLRVERYQPGRWARALNAVETYWPPALISVAVALVLAL